MGFGHGKFSCIGAQLSRVILRTVLSGLFDRLPALRLAVPPEQVEIDDTKATGGLRALPVTRAG